MAEDSKFWEGTTIGDATDAPYDGGTEFARVLLALSGALGSSSMGGVFLGNAEGVLTLSGASSPLSLTAGQALVWGSWYHNDAALSVAVPTPGSATRKDLLVLRKDWALQTIRVTRIAGVEGGGIPSPVQSVGTTWDLPLWVIVTTTLGAITLLDGRSVLGGSGSGYQTGDLKHTYRSAADPGWVIPYGQTVDASAGTSYSDLWVYANANTLIGAGLPFTGTRTALVLPNLKDMALVGFDKMGNGLVRGDVYAIAALTTLGAVTGEPTHQLTTAELAVHAHANVLNDSNHAHTVDAFGLTGNSGARVGFTQATGLQVSQVTSGPSVAPMTISNANAGSGTPHNVVQPTHGCNIMIKL